MKVKRLIPPSLLLTLTLSPVIAMADDGSADVTVGLDATVIRFSEDNGATTLYGKRLWIKWLPFEDVGFELQLNAPTKAPLSWEDGLTRTYDVNLSQQLALLFVASKQVEATSFDAMIGLSTGEVTYSNSYTTLANGTRVYHNVADAVRHDGGLEGGLRVGFGVSENLDFTAMGMLRLMGHNYWTSNFGFGLAYRF